MIELNINENDKHSMHAGLVSDHIERSLKQFREILDNNPTNKELIEGITGLSGNLFITFLLPHCIDFVILEGHSIEESNKEAEMQLDKTLEAIRKYILLSLDASIKTNVEHENNKKEENNNAI